MKCMVATIQPWTDVGIGLYLHHREESMEHNTVYRKSHDREGVCCSQIGTFPKNEKRSFAKICQPLNNHLGVSPVLS